MLRAAPIPNRAWMSAWMAGFIACKATDDTGSSGAGVGLPAENGGDTFIYDTSSGGFETGQIGTSDQTPAHWVTSRESGRVTVTPRGGPYTELAGTLSIIEVLDDLTEAPTCSLSWGLTGTAVDTACPTCTVAFDVLFYLNDGDPTLCETPDIPSDGEVRTFGWSEEEELVYFDWYDTGAWVPWYSAVFDWDSGDILLYNERVLGFNPEEEE